MVSKTPSGGIADTVSKALRRAWQLGQTYWQQADSEYTSQHKKADETQRKFDQLVEETCAALATQPPQDERGQRLSAWQISERMPTCHRQRTSLENINDVLEAISAEPAQPVALSTLTDDDIEQFIYERCKRFVTADMIPAIRALAASTPAQQATPPQPVAAEVADTQRLDWLTHRLSGAELRRIGVERASGDAYWVRIAIDEAMAGTGSDESKKGDV